MDRLGARTFETLQLAIASERASDSERASEAEGRLKGGSGEALAPPALRGGLGGLQPPQLRQAQIKSGLGTDRPYGPSVRTVRTDFL